MSNIYPVALSRIAEIAAILRGILGDDEDDDAFLDTLDGETDAVDMADRMLARLMEVEMLSEAAKAQEAALKARRARLDARVDHIRAGIGQLLDAMGVKKLERPLATVSRLQGRVSVRIDDDDAIPTQLCKIMRSPDRAAIKLQLEAGEVVPGASLVRGEDSVSVRV